MAIEILTMESHRECLTSIENIEEVKVEMQREQKLFENLVEIELFKINRKLFRT